MLRLAIGPSPREIKLPDNYRLVFGQGVALAEGEDAALFGYGPVMLHEALRASELLAEKGFGLKVINMPWLNRVDLPWLRGTLAPYERIYVVEDHAPVGGLGDNLLRAMLKTSLLSGRRLKYFAVEGYAAGGTPAEALEHHGLDGASLADRILSDARA
jgi:transketolase